MALFSQAPENSFLGIDIGDSSIKVVELAKKGKKILLINYAFSEVSGKSKFTTIEDPEALAGVLVKVLAEAGMKSKKVIVSLPSFSVFSSIISLSAGTNKKNLEPMIHEEAKKVIPLPLEEMGLDWKIIPSDIEDDPNVRVFLTGSPKKMIKKYIKVFELAGLELLSLETETFSLIRSLMGADLSTTMIVELGANSTDLCVVKGSIPYFSRSLSISGNTLTEVISEKSGMTFEQAEQLKFDLGMAVSSGNDMPNMITEAFKPIANEIKYMADLFQNSQGQKIDKIVLSGGGSLLINLSSYLEKDLNIPTIVGNPWFRVSYPMELGPVLNEVGPRLAVAVGLAMRNIE